MMTELIFLDTDILIYSSFPEYTHYCNKAHEMILFYDNLYVSNQILLDYIHTVTSFKLFDKPLEMKEALDNVEKYLTFVKLVEKDELDVAEIRRNVLKFKLDRRNIYDLSIYLIMKKNSINNIMTFNENSFKIFGDIKIINSV